MATVSKLVEKLSPSSTLMMTQRASEMKAAGIDVINLSIGEPDFPTPDHISRAAHEAIDNHITHYTPIDGFLSLREAICRKLKNENLLDYSPDQIVVSGGAKQAICNVILSLVDEGDEVLLPSPCWLSYPQMVLMAGGTPVDIPSTVDDDYKLLPSALEAAITPRTKLMVLCSPSNPTGSVYTRDELEALAEVLRRHPQVFIVSDEIYEHIRYNDAPYCSLAQFADLKDRVIIINGVSKAYAMTGWRIGWLAAEKSIAKACKKLQGQYTSCASSVSQMAALEAYNGDQTCVREMRDIFRHRRDVVLQLAAELPDVRYNKPDGAFYLMLDVSAYIGRQYNGKVIANSSELTMFLLETRHVTCVDGAPFGAPGTIRLSYATTEDDIREAFRRIKDALGLLKA